MLIDQIHHYLVSIGYQKSVTVFTEHLSTAFMKMFVSVALSCLFWKVTALTVVSLQVGDL